MRNERRTSGSERGDEKPTAPKRGTALVAYFTCAVMAREVKDEVVKTSQACCSSTGGCNAAPLSKSDRWKGAEKLDRASPVGCHKQIGLNCTGCGPSTVGRATAVSMARQRSGRLTPLYLDQPTSKWRDGTGGEAIRDGEALVSSLLSARKKTHSRRGPALSAPPPVSPGV